MRRRRKADDGWDLITDALAESEPAQERPPLTSTHAFLVLKPDGTVVGFLPEFEADAIGLAHAAGGLLLASAIAADYTRSAVPWMTERPARSTLRWVESVGEPSPIPPNGDVPVYVREVAGDGGGWTVRFEYAARRVRDLGMIATDR